MKNKHGTDTKCSIIQQHLFVFVDLSFLLRSYNVNTGPPKLVQKNLKKKQPGRKRDGAELQVTSL